MSEGKGLPEQTEIVFEGAKNLSQRASEIDVDAIGQHEVNAENALLDLNRELFTLGDSYYQALRGVADNMDSRKRRRIPLLQKPGSQEATWSDQLSIDLNQSFDFSSKLLYDKPTLTSEPNLHYYIVGMDQTHLKEQKGVHPQGLVTLVFKDSQLARLLIESRDVFFSYYDWDRIAAIRQGNPMPTYTNGSGTEFGRFLERSFGHWPGRYSIDLVFPRQGVEPEIILHHKGKDYAKPLDSSFKFSSKSPDGEPEIAFRGTVSPKRRGSILDTPSGAGWSDRTLSVPQVKEIFKGALALLPGQTKK